MSGRRGFFALVGAGMVSGVVSRRPEAVRPTLLLPPGLTLPSPTGLSLPGAKEEVVAALAGYRSEMDLILDVRRFAEREAEQAWLYIGHRLAEAGRAVGTDHYAHLARVEA
jgi:hypothetical protein